MQTDDARIGRLLRKLRRRAGMTQERLAEVSHVPVEDICDIERGRLGRLRVERVRDAFSALDGRLYLNPWWNGASADRLLDEDHAAIVEAGASLFARRGWRMASEVAFADFGERGSIDLLAGREGDLAVAVCEIKSAFGSLEETNRSLDIKVRLASKITERAFGWRPKFVGRILIVGDEPMNRRVVRHHAATMDAIYPERGRAVRAWLRKPDRSIAGIWFLSIPGNGGTESR